MRSYAEVMNDNAGRRIGVKVSYGEEIRRASFTGSSFSYLRSLCANLFSLYDGRLIGLKYKDSDGDLITMSDDSDVVEAIKQGEPLYLFVVDNKQSVVDPEAPFGAHAPQLVTPTPASASMSAPAPAPAPPVSAPESPATALNAQAPESNARDARIAAKQKQQEQRAGFHRERQELRDALAAAKEKGDKQAINECKAKLHELRDRSKAPTISPIADPAPEPGLAFAPAPAPAPAPVTVPASAPAQVSALVREANVEAKNQKRELREKYVFEKRALQEVIAAAKAKGDKQVIKKTKTMIQALRERFESNVAALSPAKPSETLTAPTSVVSAKESSIAMQQEEDKRRKEEWKEKQAAFWRERKEVRGILLAAKKKGDKQTINMCQAKLKVLQEKRDADNAARAERKAARIARKEQGKELKQELAAARTAGDKQTIIAARAKISAFRELDSDKPAEGDQAPKKGDAKNVDLKWKLVRDVTIKNGSKVPANSQVVKTWQLKNTGSVGWPQDSKPVLLGIRQEHGSVVKTEQVVGNILPNEEVEVSTTFVTPAAPGTYVAHFRMATPGGVRFGKKMATTFTI